jgi:UDP-glucose 4-epimerase
MTIGGRRFFVVGGAGFIGSYFVDKLLGSGAAKVTIFDNFTSGQQWHYEAHQSNPILQVVRGDAGRLDVLKEAMRGHDVVVHLASNPDISLAVEKPEIDFYEGTLLTNNVVEAMRRTSTPWLVYASGSGVYGEAGFTLLREDVSQLKPASTYGASKLAGEALIGSYCAMFGLRACAFRFANVVGGRQTHGVGYDFLRRLRAAPAMLRILGDGRQSKSYVHVSDVVAAVMCAMGHLQEGFAVYNVATPDAITVTEIAQMAAECLGLPEIPRWEYTGGDRGWKGDVPIVRLDTERIRALGWQPALNCREALARSLKEMTSDDRTFAV